MRFIGSLFGFVSLLLMLVGFIPMLGWLNWLVIPFAVIALVISSMVNSGSGKTMSAVAIIAGILRLMWGGGIF